MEIAAIIIQILIFFLMMFLVFRKKHIFAISSMVVSIALACYLSQGFRHKAEINIIIAAITFWIYILSLVIIVFRKIFTSDSGTGSDLLIYLIWLLVGVFLVIFFMPFFAMVPLGVMLISSIIYGIYTYRRAVLSDVLSTICSCIEQNMPLSTGLAQAAKNNTGGAVAVLNKMSGWLSQGCTLSESMKKSYGGFPGHVISLIEMSERVDQLPQATRYIKQQIFDTDNYSWSSRMGYSIFAYPFTLLIITITITFGVFTFVIPKFKTIFADMGNDIPPATQLLLDIYARYLMNPIAAILVSVFPFAVVFLYLRKMFAQRDPGSPKFLDSIGDSIKWFIPGFSWFERINSHVRVIEYLRLAMASGVSLDIAIGNCAGLDVNQRFRKKLIRWHILVESGVPVSKAARRLNLMRSLVWCFDSEYGPDNVPDAMELLEKHLSSNLQYRSNLVKEYIGPVVILLTSAVVGLTVYSIFVPMVDMIWKVIQTV